jgi:gluconokinase
MGLSGDIPWIIGASDGCLANLGSNVMDSSVLSLTIGTSGAVRKTVTTNFPDAYGRTFHYLLDENTLVTGGATNNGAILLQWFAEKFLKQSIDITSFCEQAATVNVGAQGLIFLPFLLGERAPVFDPDASGVFFGARYHHTSQHFMRAILEGIGYALLSIAEIVEKNSGGYDRVMASGGFIVSPVWVQIMADIFGRNVHVQATDDASAVGAALIGFRAIGSTPLFEFPEEKVFQPDPARHTLYQKYFSVYKDLYPHLSADFQLLNSITQH